MDHKTQIFFIRKFWWLTGIAVCLPVAWFLYQSFGPNERIIVSPETTVIAEPLRPDGLPDYARYFYELGHEGVTPVNNGAVEFWQAMWPGDLSQKDWLPMCEALGMETVPDEGSGLEAPYSQKMRRQIATQLTKLYESTLDGKELEELSDEESQKHIEERMAYDAIAEAGKYPWRSEQLPAFAEWVERNEKPLDLLLVASTKPKFWSPLPSLIGNNFQGLDAVLLPGVQKMRDAARGLNKRAMWNIGEGHNDAAWYDLRACHR